MSEFAAMLKNLTPAEGVCLTKTALQATHQRRFQQAKSILEVYDELNWKGLERKWAIFFDHYPSPEEAFEGFVQYVESLLDGGEVVLPSVLLEVHPGITG